MDPRAVVDYLTELCQDLDEGNRPHRFNLRRALAPMAIPAALTFSLGTMSCLEPMEDEAETICSDRMDNDDDGWIDCDDSDCYEDEACISVALYAVPIEDCDDGYDNDRDDLIDCEDDDCAEDDDCILSEIDCDDGIDNDGDGWLDCDDHDCDLDDACRMVALYAAPMNEGRCDDGIDNDHDGAIDCDDRDCEDLCGAVAEYAAPFN